MKRIFTSLPFILGVFVIVYIAFAVVYFQKQAEAREIDARIAPARSVLEKPAASLDSLQSQLAQLNQEFEATWASLPDSGQSIELSESFVNLAKETKVKIGSVSAATPSIKTSGNISYAVIPVTLAVQGDRKQILTFLSTLATDQSLLKSVEVRGMSLSSSTADNITTDQASLQLNIYARPAEEGTK